MKKKDGMQFMYMKITNYRIIHTPLTLMLL